MDEQPSQLRHKRFYSLKWRALLLTSLILLAINATFVYLQYQNLRQQFDVQRQRSFAGHVRLLEGLVQQSFERLRQIATTVPHLNGMQNALASADQKQIAKTFDKAWSNLQLDIGLDFAQLYTAQGELIQSWETWNMQSPPQTILTTYVQEVRRSERPVDVHECVEQCSEFVFVPMLSEGRFSGTVVIGSSLANVILGFNLTSGLDIGVLNSIRANESPGGENNSRDINDWGFKVSALTGLERNLPILRDLSRQLDITTLEQGDIAEENNHYYDVRIIRGETIAKGSNAYFVLLDDITDGIQRVYSGYRQSILTGVAGLLISEGFLLLILWRPLSRLRLTALAIPLLAQSAFEQLQQNIRSIRGGHRWYSDEFEVLDDTIIDVSHRMETMQHELEQRNAELTSANERLTEYTNILERRNRELQRFAQIASHDLQEPLRMIASYLQMLERRYKGELGADADDFIDYAVNGAKRLQNLIIAMSEYYQVLTRAKPFEKTDMEQVVRKILNEMSLQIEEIGATISHASLPKVLGDGTQLARMLRHLIDNALVYRKPDIPPQIHIGIERDGKDWLFSVKDNGIGFEPQYKERIFAIFQVLHNQHDYTGTGIGLAICKRIIEDHGGRVWAESVPGEGTTIYFTIPAIGEET